MLNALNMWFNLLVACATDAGRHSGDIQKAYASTRNHVQSTQWLVIMGVVYVFNPESFYNTNIIDTFYA